MWEVTFLEVPVGYVANSVTNAQDAIREFTKTAIGPNVNCPVVPLNSTLAESPMMIVSGWYKGQTVHYFDFGVVEITSTLPSYIFSVRFFVKINCGCD